MVNKCKVDVVKAYDVDLNYALDRNNSKNWWWEAERNKAEGNRLRFFYFLKGWSDPN